MRKHKTHSRVSASLTALLSSAGLTATFGRPPAASLSAAALRTVAASGLRLSLLPTAAAIARLLTLFFSDHQFVSFIIYDLQHF